VAGYQDGLNILPVDCSTPVSAVPEQQLLTALSLRVLRNPAEHRTTIQLKLPEPELIHVAIYDLAGRCVRNLHDGIMQAGEHLFPWDTRDNYGRNMAAGVYFGHASTPTGTMAKKIVVVR